MKQVHADATSPASLPDGYVEKADGTVAPNDLVWNPAEEAFEPVEGDASIVGTPVRKAPKVATLAHWVTYDETTGTVWGVGESPEESIQAAKFEAFGDDHGAVGYEFACWCEELSTKVCSETLYAKANEGDRLSLSDEKIQAHVVDK
ncbi:MAG: hypothetical protein BRD41_02595 [Bacteroidetes bacterium QS_1_63_11]|nr:MAG: hypothetical protein BRD41_02595 [Bacteroidetes bacterium QS_1_63_11]